MRVREKTCHRLLGVLLAVSLSLAGCGSPGETSGGAPGLGEVSAESPARPLPQIIDWSTFQIVEPQSAGLGTSWYLTENHDDWLTPVKAEYGKYGYRSTSTGTIDGMIYTNWLYRSEDEKQERFCDEDLMDGFDAQTGQTLHMELALADSGLPRDASLLNMDMASDKEAVFLTYTSGEPGQPTPQSALLFYHLEEGVQKTLDRAGQRARLFIQISHKPMRPGGTLLSDLEPVSAGDRQRRATAVPYEDSRGVLSPVTVQNAGGTASVYAPG